MKIEQFESTLLESISDKLYKKENIILEKNLRAALAPINLTFSLTNINRLQSTLICELGDSYTQQSQRYVPMNSTSISYPSNMPDKLIDEGINLIHDAFNLYSNMTKLKDPNKKGRLTSSDFVYGISYEDARYILPLAVSTNITVSMSGDKLVDLYYLFSEYPYIMKDIMMELDKLMPHKLVVNLQLITSNDNTQYDAYENMFNKLKYSNICKIDIGDKKYAAIGALNSQNHKSGASIYDTWGDEADHNSDKLIDNVLSYGHKSIIEHIRSTFAMKLSLSAYHQLIRHRLQSIHREDIMKIIDRDSKYNFYVPESFMKDITIHNQFISLMSQYNTFINNSKKIYSNEFVSMYLPNATYIRAIISANASHDAWIFRERLCMTAQTEIRELMDQKFSILYNELPDIYKNALPPCVYSGRCKEGRLGCGKANEMKEKYSYVTMK